MAGSTDWKPLTECAREMGISAKTLRRNIAAGIVDVRAVELTPRTMRVNRADWQRYLQDHTVNADQADSA